MASLHVGIRPTSLVDPRGPRFGAAVTTVVLAAALVTGSAYLLALQASVFALGAAGRPPYGVIYARLVRPRLGPPAELEDTRPLRFAQTVGLVFTVVALAGLALPTSAGTGLFTAAGPAGPVPHPPLRHRSGRGGLPLVP